MNTRETPARLEARIDLGAVRANLRRMREVAGPARVMAVVKADAYGHGMVECARAAVEAGAAWLGTALPEEALALRAAGLTAPILTWLHAPGDPFAELITAGVDVSVSGLWALREITEAVRTTGRPARIQLKADTGLGRNGAQPRDWPLIVEEAVKAQEDGLVTVTGLWSHFACADEPRHPSVAAQLAAFREALALAEAAGLRPEVRHIANSPAALLLPETHFDLVRSGLATYGVSPAPEEGSAADFGLRPAMTLVGRLALVKQVDAGPGRIRGRDPARGLRSRSGLDRRGPAHDRGPGRDGPVRDRPRDSGGRGRRRGRAVRARRPRRADRPGLGRTGGDDRLRDRHAHRSARPTRLLKRFRLTPLLGAAAPRNMKNAGRADNPGMKCYWRVTPIERSGSAVLGKVSFSWLTVRQVARRARRSGGSRVVRA
jgi:alanine racemase